MSAKPTYNRDQIHIMLQQSTSPSSVGAGQLQRLDRVQRPAEPPDLPGRLLQPVLTPGERVSGHAAVHRLDLAQVALAQVAPDALQKLTLLLLLARGRLVRAALNWRKVESNA